MYEPLRPVKLAGFLGLDRPHRGRPLRRRAPGPARHRGRSSRSCSCSASRCPSGRTCRSPTAWSSRSSASCGSASRSPTASCCATSPHGDGIVVDVLVGTFIGDTAAYLGGRAFGTRRLAPRISPSKTVEGLAFGVLGATLAVWCAGLYQDWLAGLGGARARRRGRRSWRRSATSSSPRSSATRARRTPGTLFGAHGGALDRLDAALFTLVAGYYVWLACCA